MKLILTQDVNGLGIPGDIVEVKDGYGRNYLVPQGFAIAWTKGGEKQISGIRRARKAREIRNRDHALEVKDRLESLEVSLSARAGEGGRLFGSVTPTEVVDAIRVAGGPPLDRHRIDMAAHIKSTGNHSVSARLHPEVTATFTLKVVPA